MVSPTFCCQEVPINPKEPYIADFHFGRWFGSLYRKTQAFIKEVTKALDLDLSYVETIFLINSSLNKGITQEELCGLLTIDRTVGTRALQNLEAKGMIYRLTDEADQRCKRVYPTEKGQRINERIDFYMREWTGNIIEDLTIEECAHVVSALQKMSRRTSEIPLKDFIKGLTTKYPQF